MQYIAIFWEYQMPSAQNTFSLVRILILSRMPQTPLDPMQMVASALQVITNCVNAPPSLLPVILSNASSVPALASSSGHLQDRSGQIRADPDRSGREGPSESVGGVPMTAVRPSPMQELPMIDGQVNPL